MIHCGAETTWVLIAIASDALHVLQKLKLNETGIKAKSNVQMSNIFLYFNKAYDKHKVRNKAFVYIRTCKFLAMQHKGGHHG